MTEATATADTTILRRTVIAVLAFGGIGAIGASVVYGLHTGVGVLMGALLGVLNLWALARLVRGFLTESGPKMSWTLLALIKLGALFAVVIFLVASGVADLLALAAGYGALPLGIALGPTLLLPRRDA
jgi:hypothetical protein